MPIKVFTESSVSYFDEQDERLAPFHRITAAGTVVLNDEDEILMIFRKGKWDLPKGKRENDEPLQLCAERETREETGIDILTDGRFLLTTYHTYSEKKQLILKDTHWYLFRSPGKIALQPQEEEDITKVEWVSRAALPDHTANTYLLIKEVLEAAGFGE